MNRSFFGVMVAKLHRAGNRGMAMGENTRALRLGGAVFAPTRLLKLLLLLVGLSPTVALAQAGRLQFITPPSNTTAGGIITPAVRVQVQDLFGNPVVSSAPITLAIGTNPSGGVLSGTVTVDAVNGVATFSNLSIDQVGNGYTLTAASPDLAGATSIPFNIVALAQATKLGFITQPTSTTAGGIITPAVRVAVQDPFGNIVFNSTAPITLAIGTGRSGGVLSGTLTVNAVNGVATFSNLSIDKVGKGYTLTAASPGLGGATSSPFNVDKVRLAGWHSPFRALASRRSATPPTLRHLRRQAAL